MTLPDTFLADLNARLSITDVVARRVKLIAAGKGEYKGLCPFHHEKTPSFTVSEDKGFWHCFGCQRNGDAIAFEMEAHGLTFMEAVEQLAADVGLQVPAPAPRDAAVARRMADLSTVLEAAAAWFRGNLARDCGRAAVGYLERRGVRPETAERFRLGYAPAGGLLAVLRQAGATREQVLDAGLAVERDGGLIEFFRERLMFPICDTKGNVVGFGGRDMFGRSKAKYLNSPAGPMFDKGRLVYGLHLARGPARERGRVVCCEGYMDVIACAQAGIEEVVAPLGTAVTPDQLRLLWRLAPEPILCLDGDDAGIRAGAKTAETALPLLTGVRDLRFARLPDQQDPDELLAAAGPLELHARLHYAVPTEDVLWDATVAGRRLDSAARWHALSEDLDGLVLQVEDAGRREALRVEFRRRLTALRLAGAPSRAALVPAPMPALHAVLRHGVVAGMTDRGRGLLLEAGIGEAETLRVGRIGALWVRESRERGLFQMADRRVQDDAFAAFVVPVLAGPVERLPAACEWFGQDPTADLVDLVAWDIADPSRWLVARGIEPWLGRAAVERARAEAGPLVLHPTPLAWIAAGGEGAVWLPGRAAAAGVECLRAALDGVSRVICAGGHGHAELVKKALSLRPKTSPPVVSFLKPKTAEAA